MTPPPPAVVTCEHARPDVPARWRGRFTKKDLADLKTHKGCDAGAFEIARALARRLDAPLFAGHITRLLVDLNRSEENRKGIFGTVGKRLDSNEKRRLLEKWHRPFRRAALAAVEREAERGPVLLISIHSFTPRLKGVIRNADLGLLYDPARVGEKGLCRAIRQVAAERYPRVRVRMNYPYRGVSDGTAKAARMRFGSAVAVEIELNQAIAPWLEPKEWAGLIADGMGLWAAGEGRAAR